ALTCAPARTARLAAVCLAIPVLTRRVVVSAALPVIGRIDPLPFAPVSGRFSSIWSAGGRTCRGPYARRWSWLGGGESRRSVAGEPGDRVEAVDVHGACALRVRAEGEGPLEQGAGPVNDEELVG